MRRRLTLEDMLANLVSILFPAYCQSCGGLADEGDWLPLLCGRCAHGFPFLDSTVPVPHPLDGGRALSRFEGPAKSLLVALKYRGVLRAGWVMGDRMARAPAARMWLHRADIVVPIPLHWRRRWVRGHNQAMTLVRGMVRRSEGASSCRALRRLKATNAQVGLGRADRQANVAGAFETSHRHAGRVRGARILLVDDVVTTGATAAAAGEALKRAGAAKVWLYAAAWALPHQT